MNILFYRRISEINNVVVSLQALLDVADFTDYQTFEIIDDLLSTLEKKTCDARMAYNRTKCPSYGKVEN